MLGLDSNDKALFSSAFTKDVTFDFNGELWSGVDAMHTGMFDKVSTLDTTHFITNVRVNVQDGASTASMTASALAQHYRAGQGTVPGATRLLSGSLYFLDLVKNDEDGLWQIKHWKLKFMWAEGNWDVMKVE